MAEALQRFGDEFSVRTASVWISRSAKRTTITCSKAGARRGSSSELKATVLPEAELRSRPSEGAGRCLSPIAPVRSL